MNKIVLFRNKQIESMNKSSENYHFSIVFLAFLVNIYAPYEMYITNVNEFWFSLTNFIPYCIINGIIFAIILEVILKICHARLKIVIEFCILFLEIAIYVQGTFLNIDIGKLTGINFVSSKFIMKCIGDIFLWIFIFFVFLLLYRRSFEIYAIIQRYLPFFLLVVLLLTSLVLFYGANKNEKEKISTGTFFSDYNINTFGDEDNIIIFVLDMFDRDYLSTIIKEYPEELDNFDGFTVYNNHTGGYATTVYSFALLNSGQYFHNETSINSFCREYDTYISRLLEMGYKIGNYGGVAFPYNVATNYTNLIHGELKVNNKVKFIIKIYEMGAFRYAPNICKPFLLNFQNHLYKEQKVVSEYNYYSDNNIDVYKSLSDVKTEVENGKWFKMIYARGVHYPYENDEMLNRVDSNNEYPIECARGALKMVSKYLQNMKDAGVYDNSTIIITADHGYYSDYGMNKFTNPMMMIKKKNAIDKISINNAPTSHLDIAATVVDAATGKSENEFGKSIFAYNESDKRERYYYHYYLKEKGDEHRLIEFSIDNDSNKEDAFRLTGNEYTINGNLINHYAYCKTCQTGDHEGHGVCWHAKANNYPKE